MSCQYRTLSPMPATSGFDCARCNGRGEVLTHPWNGSRQWMACFACDATGCVLPQYRTVYGPNGTEAKQARNEWHATLAEWCAEDA